MKFIKDSYAFYFRDKSFLISFFGGLVFLAASLVLQFYASAYATRRASLPVTDIVLSNTRVYDVNGFFVYGAVVLFFICFFVCLSRINLTPFIIKSIALFTVIRSIFISLTHISPYPTHVLMSSIFFQHKIFDGIFTGDGLFFSGHTGLPFLLALMFWDNKYLRYVFLGFSVTFAVVVLLGHLHYSIDVFSAFFITYSIFHLCQLFFKKDWQLFLKKGLTF